jgi:iron complex transport system ATP-binding protein
LSCGYPRRAVLASVDLEFSTASATAIIGPNGSGKSTLLKTLAGELTPISGEIFLAGQPISAYSISDLARNIAVVPQQEHIPFRFTVWEIVMMGRLAHADGVWDTPSDRAAVEQALGFTDCLQFKDRFVTELSGGERQRAMIARALAQETGIIVLDEPTTHLDVTHQLDLCQLVRQMVESGKTIIAAMHDLNLIGQMASRAVLIGCGQVLKTGTSQEVLNSPELDRAYQVEFRRVLDGGKTVVLPPVG